MDSVKNNEKLKYWETKHQYKAFMSSILTDKNFIRFINEVFLSLKSEEDYKAQGFKFDRNIFTSTEFYYANQNYLISLYKTGGQI